MEKRRPKTRRWPSPQELLRRHGLWAKRSWSQNFLVDAAVPPRIAAALNPQPHDVVIELGAGLGHLTAALAATGARVVAVERDRDLIPVLRAELELEGDIRIEEGNALTFDIAGEASAAGRPVLIAGNLPYHLTGPLLGRLLTEHAHIARFAVMVQLEVAERLVSGPFSRRYGAISVRLALWSEARIVLRVPRRAFHPKPKVDSAVVVGAMSPEPRAEVDDLARFDQLVRSAFSMRRKTLSNALRPLLGTQTRTLLRAAGLDPGLRAEAVDLEGFAALARTWTRDGETT